jgi:hypothetical protein
MASDNLIPDASPGQGAAPRGSGPSLLDYRSLQAPAQVLEQRQIPDNGAASRAEALSRAFADFGSEAGNVARKLNTQAGAQAGAAAGLDPMFAPKTGLASITAYGGAYNAAAHVSYVNNTQASIEDQLSKAEAANQGNPQGFAESAQAIHDAVVKEAPPMYQPEISNMISLRTVAGMTRTREQAIQTARSDAFESYTSTVNGRQSAALETAATLPDDKAQVVIQNTLQENRTQLDALVAARAITPEKSAILQRHFEEQFTSMAQGQHVDGVVQKMMDIARSGDVDSADKALHAYIADPNNSDTDKTVVTQHYLDESEKFQKLQSRVLAPELASVGQQLVQGSGQLAGQGAYGPQIESRIHALYKQGAINPEALRSLMDTSMRNQVQAIGNEADNMLIDAAVHGGQKLDPADKALVNATDTYFKSHIAINGAAPGTDLYASGAVAFARETNIVPPSVRSNVRVGLMSGDPVAAAKAAQLADRLQQANPQASPFDDSEPKLSALSGLINSNLKAGMTPQQSYSLAIQQTSVTPELRETREKNYGKAITAGTPNNQALQSALNKAAPGLFSSAPAAPVAMQAAYGSLVQQLYDQTGDLPKSQELAAIQLQKTWGVTSVNGKPELTKYPINDRDVPTVRADIATSAKAAGYDGDPSQIHLTPNALTDQTQGRVWSLTHTDSNGVEDVLLDSHNQPLQYHVPGAQDFAKQRQQLIDAKMDAARKQRDFERSVSADQIQGEQALSDFYLTPAGRRQENSVSGNR